MCDEDQALVDDDGLDRPSLELLAGGSALQVAVFRPLVLSGFQIEERGGIVTELALIGALVRVGNVGLEGLDGVVVEVVQKLIGRAIEVGVAEVEVDGAGVGCAGIGPGLRRGLRVGCLTLRGWNYDLFRWWWWRRFGAGELSVGQRRRAEQKKRGQNAV